MRKNHKFDIFDVCERCGCQRRNVSHVGDGYNTSLKNRFGKEYSLDGVNWSSEFINCKNGK